VARVDDAPARVQLLCEARVFRPEAGEHAGQPGPAHLRRRPQLRGGQRRARHIHHQQDPQLDCVHGGAVVSSNLSFVAEEQNFGGILTSSWDCRLLHKSTVEIDNQSLSFYGVWWCKENESSL
jgi:hypothetical protein